MMNFKNFRMNKKAASKIAASALVGSLATASLTGCGNVTTGERHNILKGTILEDSVVVTFADGTKDIAVRVGECNGWICGLDYDSNLNHYCSVISGQYFSDDNCRTTTINGDYVLHYEIDNVEDTVNYLTTDELKKALETGLDDNDVVSIVTRAVAPNEEQMKLKKAPKTTDNN